MKTVVVTGSTRGIGLGLTANFLRRGCKVIVSSRRQEDVDQVVQQLGLDFGADQVAGLACDITSFENLQGLWDFAVSRFGSVDIWINNAGINIDRAPLWQQSAQALSNIVNTNLTGLLLANKVAMTGMNAQGRGQIWNMEGFGSNGMAQPGMAAYGATKRAVNYLNKALRKDTAGTNIQVCTLSPGMVVTDLLIGEYDTSSQEWKKVKRMFNILADTVDTVTPWLVDEVLKADRDGAKVEWLTNGKVMGRFLTAAFRKRDLFADMGI
jgi:NAD(P)-dependent dehydrogenase (short-subunit alcohol dehydrogenase family)